MYFVWGELGGDSSQDVQLLLFRKLEGVIGQFFIFEVFDDFTIADNVWWMEVNFVLLKEFRRVLPYSGVP